MEIEIPLGVRLILAAGMFGVVILQFARLVAERTMRGTSIMTQLIVAAFICVPVFGCWAAAMFWIFFVNPDTAVLTLLRR